MPQYVEGPEAKGMESGFALDELLRRERSANARQILGEVAQRDQQQARQRFAQEQAEQQQKFMTDQAAQEQKYAIERMLKGEELKEQGAQKEAERGAAALQALINGNPEAARTLGYEPGKPDTIQRTGAMAEPEAMGIQAPITPGVARRMPTLEEAAGLTRSMPGIAQALFQQKMSATKPQTAELEPGKLLFERDPATGKWNQVAAGPEKAVDGQVFPTVEAAQAYWDAQVAANPRLSRTYRPQIMSDPAHGGYKLNLMTNEPLSQNPAIWVDQANDPSLSAAERAQARQRLQDYNRYVVQQAGEKSSLTTWNTWRPDEVTRIRENSERAANLERLDSYTPGQMAMFLGAPGKAADVAQYLAGVPGGMDVLKQFGNDPQAFLAQAAEFKQAQTMDLKYVLSRVDGAGGTMTAQERDLVIGQFAGGARNPAEMKARLRVHRAVLLAERDLVNYRHEADPGTYAANAPAFFKQRLEQYAPGIMNPGQGGVKSQMAPRDRFRQDMGRQK